MYGLKLIKLDSSISVLIHGPVLDHITDPGACYDDVIEFAFSRDLNDIIIGCPVIVFRRRIGGALDKNIDCAGNFFYYDPVRVQADADIHALWRCRDTISVQHSVVIWSIAGFCQTWAGIIEIGFYGLARIYDHLIFVFISQYNGP